RDKRLPKKNFPIRLPYALYFAKSSKIWHGGGVAFINPNRQPTATTLGRRYLITNDQFIELIRQEGHLKQNPGLDFDQVQRERTWLFSNKAWYNQLVFLGTDCGVPMFTFTHNRVLRSKPNPPNPAYLK